MTILVAPAYSEPFRPHRVRTLSPLGPRGSEPTASRPEPSVLNPEPIASRPEPSAPNPVRISIVTPSYNQGKYLEKTILSVLEQGYPNLEYIIIDGGSSDESVEIIKKYADRLAWWVSEPDRGQSHAINKGFARATGEIFGWLNSDDWYQPGALQAVAEAFAAHPEAGAVVGAGEMVDEKGQQLLFKAPTKVDLDFLYHWLDDFFWQPSCFFSRRAWEKCGPLELDLHYAMDLDLWLRIVAIFPFPVTDANLSMSLKHADAKTTADIAKTLVEALQVITRHGGGNVAATVMHREIAERDRQLHQLLAELNETVGHIHTANHEIIALNGKLCQAERALADVRAELATVYASASWRGTRLIRWLGDRMQRVRDRT